MESVRNAHELTFHECTFIDIDKDIKIRKDLGFKLKTINIVSPVGPRCDEQMKNLFSAISNSNIKYSLKMLNIFNEDTDRQAALAIEIDSSFAKNSLKAKIEVFSSDEFIYA